jgi:signal transduction histidine kinase
LLVRFSRLASAAKAPQDILPLLARAAVDDVGAHGAGVLQIGEDGVARLVAAAELPAAMAAWSGEVEVIGSEAGDALVRASAGAFGRAATLPLVSGGNLYGALVLLWRDDSGISDDSRHLAEALCDLAATALEKASQFDALARSYAELRESREILAQSEKLRALGQAVAGISHDIKNILNPLALQAQLLRRRIESGKDPEKVTEVLAMLQSSLAHGLEVVERLRDFSRQEPSRAALPVELDEVVAQAVELARPRCAEIGRPVALDVELGTPPLVLGNASELVAAVVNLLVNACDALQSSGQGTRVTLRTGTDGGGAFVEVEDDGPGMTPEVRARVFEPFFTTKGKDGTGLGLAMVYALAQRHSGQVTLATEPGTGARFRLWFPATR